MFDFLFIVKWYFFGRLKIGRKSRKKNAFAEFNRALSNLNKGSYVIDCGANVGEFTKLFLEKGFFVDAFEPDPIAINELKKNCKNNKNLNLFQSAVGLKENTQKLFRYRKFDENDPYSTQGSSLLDYRSGTNKPFVEIKVIDFINHINKQKKDISLLKMDIEGSEIEILNKIIDLNIHDKIKYIFVETHERFSHKLGLETAKLKLRIKNLNIKNINLDWV
jgi:FkbM family methyltransferase